MRQYVMGDFGETTTTQTESKLMTREEWALEQKKADDRAFKIQLMIVAALAGVVTGLLITRKK